MEQLAIHGGKPTIQTSLPSIRNSSGRYMGDEEKRLLAEVIDSGCLAFIYGSKVTEFERSFAELIGARQAVATSSGTAALHTALLYLNPEPGDEVLVSPITDMGSVIPILSQLAVPVFVDVDPHDHNMDPAKIEEQISSRTRAILVTHIYGSPADMDPIMEIARKHDLFVIEDCAQAQLTCYKGRVVGTIGNVSCYSFQQSKHMTTGDGGMALSNEDERFGRKLRHCMDKGWPRERGGRDHLFLAPNYHMTELQAAVGLAQIKRLKGVIEARRRSAKRLDALLNEIPAALPVSSLAESYETRFFYVFRLQVEALRVDGVEIANALIAEGVPCFLGYPGKVPLYKYPMIKDRRTFGTSGWPFTLDGVRRNWDYADEICPNAERACRESIVIWWNEKMTDEHVHQIARAIEKVLRAYGR